MPKNMRDAKGVQGNFVIGVSLMDILNSRIVNTLIFNAIYIKHRVIIIDVFLCFKLYPLCFGVSDKDKLDDHSIPIKFKRFYLTLFL